MNSAVVWDVSEDEYNADTKYLRASALKHAIRSPGEYRDRYITKTIADERTKSMILGSIVHCKTLEPELFYTRYAIRPDGIDGRTKEGKAKLTAWRLANLGKQCLSDTFEDGADMVARADKMAAAIHAEPFLGDLIASAIRERAIIWTDDETGLACKCRPDLLVLRPDFPRDQIIDLKTSDDPSPEEWNRGGMYAPVPKYRYDLQGAHYCDGVSRLTNRPCDYGLIVVGSRPPHDVYTYDLTAWLPIGEKYRRLAMQNVLRGTTEGNWRRPCQGAIISLAPTKWDEEALSL